jgi:hypothetical protein
MEIEETVVHCRTDGSDRVCDSRRVTVTTLRCLLRPNRINVVSELSVLLFSVIPGLERTTGTKVH